jgi:hypothetical protein
MSSLTRRCTNSAHSFCAAAKASKSEAHDAARRVVTGDTSAEVFPRQKRGIRGVDVPSLVPMLALRRIMLIVHRVAAVCIRL